MCQSAKICAGANKMKEKRLIIFPTDTVYGIGCGIFDKESIEKIYTLKKRPRSKPLACLCANLEQIKEIALIGESEEKLIKKFLPGALTIILKAKTDVVKTTGFDTIGVRIPNSKVALSILNEYGPMLTTSVNESEQIPLNTYEEIMKKFGKDVDKVFKSSEKSSNMSSTVVKIENDKPVILREGEIKKHDIEAVLFQS